MFIDTYAYSPLFVFKILLCYVGICGAFFELRFSLCALLLLMLHLKNRAAGKFGKAVSRVNGQPVSF